MVRVRARVRVPVRVRVRLRVRVRVRARTHFICGMPEPTAALLMCCTHAAESAHLVG